MSYSTYRLTRFGNRALLFFEAYGTKLTPCFQLSWSDFTSLLGGKGALLKILLNALAVLLGTRVLLITLNY